MSLVVAEHDAFIIAGGRIIDPFTGRDEVADVFVVNGRIADSAPRDAHRIHAEGCMVCPGLMDMHVHLREPGQSHKETIEMGTAAAAAGGFTRVACMPNTKPPLDSPDVVRWVRQRSEEVGLAEVLPVACITKGRAGNEVTDFAVLKEAGAVAFSDDGTGVENDAVMLEAFRRVRETDSLLIQHCEYRDISAGGVIHKGEVSERLNLPGLDPRSEEAMVERDIDLCRRTGGRYHIAHISTAKAVEMVRRAKSEGLPITTEVCTHHLLLTDQACSSADPNTKMHPPLRPRSDVEACRIGLLDGTIDAIVTDHAPHTSEEKSQGMLKAPAGIVGLETAIGVAVEAMIESGLADWTSLVRWFTTAPNRLLLRLENEGFRLGEIADLTIINPISRWTVNPANFHSKSQNTPFTHRSLMGKAVATIRRRRVVSAENL